MRCSSDSRTFVCSKYFEDTFHLAEYPAEICNSLIYFISILGCAPAGALIDAFGRNAL